MTRITLRVCLLSLTLTGSVWAQAPEPVAEPVAPAPAPVAPAPAPVAAPAPAAQVQQTAVVPLSSLPATLPYRRERGAPEGYVLTEEPRRGLVIGGVAVLGAAYISGLLATGVVLDFPNKTAFLAIPVAGPWITLAARDKKCDGNDGLDCAGDELARRMLVIDGLVQAIGTGLIVTGFTWTKSMWLREDLANVELIPSVNVASLPGVPTPQGMSLVGRF